MLKIGNDVFIADTCSFASTITEIKDNKICVPFADIFVWYESDSWKVKEYTDEKINATLNEVMFARDYRIKKDIK